MQTQREVLGWTLVRAIFGLSLSLGHGLSKVRGGVTGLSQGVAELGFPFPLFFAWCATLAEFVGGLLIAVGLFTRPAAAFASFTMLVALYRHRVDPFAQMEKALLFLAVFIAVIAIGAGPWSLDARRKRRL